MKVEIPSTKAELCQYFGFSRSTLHRLLNVKYFNELAQCGYEKNQIILPPKVVRKFIEIWGKQLDENDI